MKPQNIYTQDSLNSHYKMQNQEIQKNQWFPNDPKTL